MINAIGLESTDSSDGYSELFKRIACDIFERGYSIVPNALPLVLAENLLLYVQTMPPTKFDSAGVGRHNEHTMNRFVRTDEICWISGESAAGRQWLDWAAELQCYLNRHLLLGLFSFESHFAHYRPGDYYKKHVDAFKGEANRVLSLVCYLNPHWAPDDGGELKIYLDEKASTDIKSTGIESIDIEGAATENSSIKVTPAFATLVVFLSEEFAHEVLPATRDRYSIAGWFRVNTSTTTKIDPPT